MFRVYGKYFSLSIFAQSNMRSNLPVFSEVIDCGITLYYFTSTGGIIPEGIREDVLVPVFREDHAVSGDCTVSCV